MERLNSVLKNVPMKLRNELLKYHTKNSRHKLRWKVRQPKNGYKYGWGGSLPLAHAKSADLYVDGHASDKEYRSTILENYDLKRKNTELLERIENLQACYQHNENEITKLLPIKNVIDALISLVKESTIK